MPGYQGRRPEASFLPVDVPKDDARRQPEILALARDAVQDVLHGFEVARAVPTASERDAVRQVQAQIIERRSRLQQGDDAQEFLAYLVGITAARDGPFPFLARLLATQEIAHLHAEGKINLDEPGKLKEEFLEAIATEPAPRGSLHHQGMLESVIRRAPGEQHGLSALQWIPSLQDDAEKDRFRREAMVEVAANLFASDPGMSMNLMEWTPGTGGELLFGTGGTHPAGHMVPKYVVRLSALRTTVDNGGRSSQELRCHICSPQMQWVAAAFGMPAADQYDAAGLVARNPTAVLTVSRLALDEAEGDAALRVQGIGVDAFRPMDDSQRAAVEKEIEGFQGGLPYLLARDMLPADGLTPIAAARALRRLRGLSPAKQRERVHGAIGSVIRELQRPATIQHLIDGEVVDTRQTSILTAYTNQFNDQRGQLESPPRHISEEEAAESLRVALVGALCTEEAGMSVIRPERDLVRLTWQLTRRGIPREDRVQFPRLANSGETKIETISRRTTPGGARPPVTIKGK